MFSFSPRWGFSPGRTPIGRASHNRSSSVLHESQGVRLGYPCPVRQLAVEQGVLSVEVFFNKVAYVSVLPPGKKDLELFWHARVARGQTRGHI